MKKKIKNAETNKKKKEKVKVKVKGTKRTTIKSKITRLVLISVVGVCVIMAAIGCVVGALSLRNKEC
jgi:hypothetical protein